MAPIEHEVRAFQTLTLLLAVAEQALLDLGQIAKPDEETQAAILELCERLYLTLQPGGHFANQIHSQRALAETELLRPK
jgi:hypothetical protein